MTVGERIRAFAKAQYKTQAAFGEAVGMSEQAVSNLVQGRQIPATETLVRFADVGMNVDWLLTGRGDMLAAPDTPSSPIVGEPMSPEGWNTTESYVGPADMASIGLQRILALHERQTEEMRRAIAEELARG